MAVPPGSASCVKDRTRQLRKPCSTVMFGAVATAGGVHAAPFPVVNTGLIVGDVLWPCSMNEVGSDSAVSPRVASTLARLISVTVSELSVAGTAIASPGDRTFWLIAEAGLRVGPRCRSGRSGSPTS